jgi:hypothetical protein
MAEAAEAVRPRPRPRSGLLVVLLSIVRLAPSATAADDLNTERGRVLTLVGPVKDLTSQTIVLQPLESDVGLVFVRDHREPGARSLRLHFKVENDTAPPSWALKVKDSGGKEVWSAAPSDGVGTAFWSDEIPGDRAKVEVYSTTRANPVRIRIDRVAIRNDKVDPLSITGKRNDLKSIRGQDAWIVEDGRSVARLRFVADSGGLFSCTAFLVTRDLLLTNQHCIATDSERDSALVDFDYDTDRLAHKPVRLKELAHTSFALDYAVVRMQKPADRHALKLDTTQAPDGEHLLVIQHPAGEPKQVSLRDCVVDGPSVKGREHPDTDFGHQCDPMTGSSGSPVFRLETRTVVGLHHLAYDQGALFNRAVHIQRVLRDLPSALRTEIEAGPPVPCPSP